MSVTPLNPTSVPILEVDAELVSDLKMLLDAAEAGKLQGLAYVGIKSTGTGTVVTTSSGYCGQGLRQNVFVAIGKIEHLKARIFHELVSGLP